MITHIHVVPYTMSFVSPVRLGRNGVLSRSGWSIKVVDDKENEGVGDIVAMPSDHLDRCAVKMQLQLAMRLPSQTGSLGLTPAVAWGLSSAMLDMSARQAGLAMRKMLHQSASDHLRLQGIVSNATDEAACATWISEGVTTLKIKVGVDWKKEMASLESIRTRWPHIIIRLDANQMLPCDEAIAFGKVVAPLNIEWIEEPCATLVDNAAFYHETGVSVALDESMANGQTIGDEEKKNGIVAVILKPSWIGDLETIRCAMASAHAVGVRTVISEAFPSCVGWWSAAQVAAAWAPEEAHGLGTFRYMSADMATPVVVDGGIWLNAMDRMCQAMDITNKDGDGFVVSQ